MIRARTQRGTATVEFAIVGALFFTLLFGVVEFGRAMYTWNALSEVARRGARVAAVCPLNHSAIERIALFSKPGDTGPSRFIHNLHPENIQTQYLDEDGGTIADPTANYSSIRFVRVAISGFQYNALIPFFGIDHFLSTPGFAATLPRESLGIPREGDEPVCFGTSS